MYNNRPNFLLVGAAKCGTTSLSNYLNQHPDIYIPEIKEPRYFVSNTLQNINREDPTFEHLMSTSVFNKNQYYRLFKTDRQYKKYGESSIHYLYENHESIPKIISELGDIHIIIILRNPAIRAISNYYYLEGGDNLKNGLKNEEYRKNNNWDSFWYYKSLGLYYEQVKIFKENFDKVKVVLFDDFINNTKDTCKNIYKFLDADDKFIPNTSIKSNPTKIIKNKFYIKLVNLEEKLPLTKNIIKRLVPFNLRRFKKKFYLDSPKYHKHKHIIEELQNIYSSNITKLEKLLDISLKKWKP